MSPAVIDPAGASGRRESHASRVSRLLLERIRSGDFPVGTRIPSERTLATEFGVSRPVVREAISNISALGMLDVQVGRGAFVTASTSWGEDSPPTTLRDVINVREVLEVGALTLAGRLGEEIQRDGVRAALAELERAVRSRSSTAELDSVLHREIVRAAASPLLVATWEQLEGQIEQTIRVSPHGQVMSSTILELHRQLAEGILSGATEGAVEASRALHQQNRDFLRSLLG